MREELQFAKVKFDKFEQGLNELAQSHQMMQAEHQARAAESQSVAEVRSAIEEIAESMAASKA